MSQSTASACVCLGWNPAARGPPSAARGHLSLARDRPGWPGVACASGGEWVPTSVASVASAAPTRVHAVHFFLTRQPEAVSAFISRGNPFICGVNQAAFFICGTRKLGLTRCRPSFTSTVLQTPGVRPGFGSTEAKSCVLLVQQGCSILSATRSFVLKNTSNECYEFLYRKI